MTGRTAALAALIAVVAAVPAGAAKPNMKSTKVSPPPRAVAEYSKFKVSDVTKNVGGGRVGKTYTRYYLSTDPKRSQREREESKTDPRTAISDILLEGGRVVPSRKKRVEVRVPLGTPAGEYFLLACADDHADVKESKETDNCVASRKVKIAGRGLNLETVTFNDWLLDRTDEEEAKDLGIYKPLACAPTPVSATPGLQKALANIDAFLKSKAPQGVQQFAKSPEYKTATKAETAAAHALLEDSPGAALAATVRAHRLEPKEASHLVNAAGLATAVGMPRDALAMLDASLRLDDKVPSSWGFNRQALQLTNRAHALAAIGRFAEAEKLTEAVETMEPALTEATATGAMAAMCQNATARAVSKRKKARRRTARPPHPFDETRGTEHPLRKVELPGFPRDAPRFDAFYEAEQRESVAHTGELVDRQNALEDKLRAKDIDPLTERQAGRVMSALYAAGETPALEAKRDEMERLNDEIVDYMIRFFCHASDCEPENHFYNQFSEESSKECEGSKEKDCYRRVMNEKCRPALKSYHQGWLTRMEAFWAATNSYHRAVSKRMDAIAQHISDPDRHALALLQIDLMEEAHYGAVLQMAGWWAQDEQVRADMCIEPYEDPNALNGEDAAGAGGTPCPDVLKSSNALLDVGPVQLKFSCEQVQLAGNLGEGWIRGFGEVTYDFKAGKISVFAGSQGEVAAGPFKADFKSGLYVTVNQQGFEDAGWRVGPSVTAGAGPVEYNPSDMVDISFVGIFSGGAR